tara:strand:- start:3847 stop:4470 length:624 start_codon:yes stop_codon:yes gene_type:complete
VKYSDFNLFIRPEVQGCPDFMIERAVRDSVIDFCQRTDIYKPEPEFVTIIKGINEYEVSLPLGTELNHIIDIFRDSTRLKPVSYTDLIHKLGDEQTQGSPSTYSQRDNDAFFLAPIPDANDSYRVLYSVKPTSSSTSIPDTFGKENREIIVHGSLYRLQMMSGQPFSNPAAASDNKRLFDRGVGRVARQVKYGYGGGSLTCKFREFI